MTKALHALLVALVVAWSGQALAIGLSLTVTNRQGSLVMAEGAAMAASRSLVTAGSLTSPGE